MRFLISALVIGIAVSRIATAAAPDPEAAYRIKISPHLSSLAEKAELAIRQVLLTEKKDEDNVPRHYISGDIDGDGQDDLLVVTTFTNGSGNYWGCYFVLILSSAPDRPIIKQFGGKSERAYDSINMNEGGISVDFLYYGGTDALCCPSIKKKGHFILKNSTLVEEGAR